MEILLTGMKISHINTRKQAGLAAGLKVGRCHRKLLERPGKQNEISSYKHKTNSSCLPGCLAKQASPLITIRLFLLWSLSTSNKTNLNLQANLLTTCLSMLNQN